MEQFSQRLAQTIYWCSRKVDTVMPRDCLRTPALSPGIFEASRFSAVDTVAIERERWAGPEIRQAGIPPNLGNGRLLVYFPEANLCCGGAEQETDGFFDVNNVPAWDTWVAYFAEDETHNDLYRDYLISWIPPELVELVGQGIWVNPEECIIWLEDAPANVAKAMRKLNLLI